MSRISIAEMGWSERMTVCSSFDLQDPQTAQHVCEVLNITEEELESGIGLVAGGDCELNQDIDPAEYTELFDLSKIKLNEAVAQAPQEQTGTARPDLTQAPQTATSAKVKGKRGRSGDKIDLAFQSIPHEPVSLESFRTQHGVSVPVLRQQKRFDKFSELGKVRVKKDGSGELTIYREQPE